MEALAIASRIEAVTVYREGARITRVAELTRNGDGFPRWVRLGGLPLGLWDGTARVWIDASGDASPTASELRVVLDVPERDPSLRPADDRELEDARAERRKVRQLVEQIGRELAQLASLEIGRRPKGAAGEPPVESPTGARLALLAFRQTRETSLHAELREAQDQLEQIERRVDELEDLDRRATSARQAREHELRKAALIQLRDTDAAADSVQLRLEYVVPGARWAPTYVARLDRQLTRAELAVRAVVAQNTGEDWLGVNVTLSTAEPQRWTELPELTSLRIGRKQPRPPKTGWRPPPTGVGELYRDWDRSFRDKFYDRPPPQRAAAKAAALAEPESETVANTGAFMAVPADELAGAAEEFDDAPTMSHMVTRAGSYDAKAMAEVEARIRLEHQMRVEQQRLQQEVMRVEAPARKSRGLSFSLPSFGRSDKSRPAPQSAPVPGAALSTSAMGPLTDMLALEAHAAASVEGDMLRYGDLRMPDARSSRRGALVIAGQRELYMELLVQESFEVSFDLVGCMARAAERASIDASLLPYGCELAWSESYDYAYPGDARVDIPSDGDFHSIPLAASAAECMPLYIVVPRESTDVFRTARVKNPLDAPLLAGPVDVYWGGEFLLTSAVDFTPPRGEVDLGLGVEQAIKVSRNTRYREETAGLIGGSLELHHRIEIEVRNNLDREVPVEVRERLPVVLDDEDDIEITLGKVSPPWREYEQPPESPSEPELRGGHRWNLALPAGGSQELRVDYEVKIASKHELVGGNRREG